MTVAAPNIDVALQVSYPIAVASLLHLAPLALTILTLIAMMKSATHDEVYDQFRATVVPVIWQAGLSVASFLCAVLVPAALGALRAGLSGESVLSSVESVLSSVESVLSTVEGHLRHSSLLLLCLLWLP